MIFELLFLCVFWTAFTTFNDLSKLISDPALVDCMMHALFFLSVTNENHIVPRTMGFCIAHWMGAV